MPIVTHRAVQENLLGSLQDMIMEKLIFLKKIKILDFKYRLINLKIISTVQKDYLLLN